MSSAAAELKVKKLARLPSNSVCANCGTGKKFGFSTVCIKFFTFVCNNCKSSHQAISHRCKSLTMSSWTDAEVAELEAKGNDYARRTWLKNAPPVGTGGRPKEGDHVDVFKRFVVDVYERKRYYGEDTGVPPVAVVPQLHVATAIPISQPSPTAARQFALPPVAAPVPPLPVAAPAPRPPAPAATFDLLDFSGPAPAPASFQAKFDAFGSTPAPSASSFRTDFGSVPISAPAPSGGSAFGFISATPAATPAPTPAPMTSSSGFAFLAKPPAAAAPAPAVTSSNNDFADFAGLTISSSSPALPQSVAAKKPVMSHSATSQKGSLISSMDTMSAPSHPSMGFGSMMPQQQQQQQQQGAFGGMGTNGGMGMNMNNMSQQQRMMMQQQQQRMMMMQQQQQGMGTGMGMGMGGMNMNSNGMGMNPGMMGGGPGMTGAGMNNSMGIGMMTPQQMMNFGGAGQPNSGNKSNMNNQHAMNGLSMSGMDMNAWTTGKK